MKSGSPYVVAAATAFVAVSMFVASPADAVLIIDKGVPTSVVLGLTPDELLNPTAIDAGANTPGGFPGGIGPHTENFIESGGPAIRRNPLDTLPNVLGREYYAIGQGGTNTSLDASSPVIAKFNVGGTFLDIIWGSPDTNRNSIVFFFDTIDPVTVTAANANAATASSGEGSGYANIRITDFAEAFTRFELRHFGSSAFEWTNAVVPLPAAAWFVLTALAGMGVYYRRYGRPAQLAAA